MSPDSPPNPEKTPKNDMEKESLESLSNEFGGDSFGLMSSEKRKNRNNWIASILALALWSVLIFTIAYHLITTVNFSNRLLSSDSPVELEKVQTAVTLVDDTAKTLYSFLGTLVTAVTAYYFKTVADEVNRNSS